MTYMKYEGVCLYVCISYQETFYLRAYFYEN